MMTKEQLENKIKREMWRMLDKPEDMDGFGFVNLGKSNLLKLLGIVDDFEHDAKIENEIISYDLAKYIYFLRCDIKSHIRY